MATSVEPASAGHEIRAAVTPEAKRRWTWGRELLPIGIVALVFALPLRGLMRAPGPPMEEGFMLVFPEQVLKGAIPNKDFLHLYGPGSLWMLAGVFKVFGISLWSERVFGLLQQVAIVFGIYALARRWNRTLAVVCATCSGLVIIPFGLTALAWVGAVGLGMCGLATGIAMRSSTDERVARRWALGSGLLLGVAILFRLDLVIAVTLSGLALCWGIDRARRNRFITGLVLGVAAYAIHIATAGPGNVWRGMVLDPVFHLRGGRSLPIPPPWGHLDGFLQKAGAIQQLSWPLPAPGMSQQLFLWFFALLAVIAFLVYEGVRAVQADRIGIRPRVLLVVALFSLGILPQALQRVDSAHFAWVGCVPFGFLPIGLYEAVRRRRPDVRARPLSIVCSAAGLAVLLFVIPAFTVTRYADYSLQTFGIHRSSYIIRNDGRTFYYGKDDRARAAQMVLDAADRITKPGQRLFVGTGDLRKTPYSDAYLYYMLPDLTPATYYIEMDPGVANAPNSGLDKQLASADIAIMSKIWDNWSEPNDSRNFGSDKPVQVLNRDFCLVGNYLDLYELYQKCSERAPSG